MARSTKKGPFVDEILYRRVVAARDSGQQHLFRTWSRSCTIVPEFVGTNFEVHNGKIFVKVFVTEDMVGHKLGEFSPSRTFKSHTAGRGK